MEPSLSLMSNVNDPPPFQNSYKDVNPLLWTNSLVTTSLAKPGCSKKKTEKLLLW